ncbi:MAG: hypothetical protein R2855_14025 [Thermomicrobiales bacterium]
MSDNQAGNANALVIGGFQQSLGVYLYENEALDRLVEVAALANRHHRVNEAPGHCYPSASSGHACSPARTRYSSRDMPVNSMTQ